MCLFASWYLKGLNVLDMTIFTKNKQIEFSWFQKQCHSGITMQKDTFIPHHIKNNFVESRLKDIRDLCSSENLFRISSNKFTEQLKHNGFKQTDFTKQKGRKNKKQNLPDYKKQPCLSLPFINNKCDKKIRQLLKKYNMKGNLVSKPNNSLEKHLKNRKKKNNTCTCDICTKIGPKHSCNDRYIVYQFTCKICKDFYIGKTARTFKMRYREHKYGISKKDTKNALAQHSISHGDRTDIGDFDIKILSKKNNTRDTTIEECRFIDALKPKINRKHEMTQYPIITKTHARGQFWSSQDLFFHLSLSWYLNAAVHVLQCEHRTRQRPKAENLCF